MYENCDYCKARVLITFPESKSTVTVKCKCGKRTFIVRQMDVAKDTTEKNICEFIDLPSEKK